MTTKKPEIPIGTIFDAQWGYDQTNSDFYEVVKASAQFVTVRRIAAMDAHDAGSMTGKKLPLAGNFTGKPIRRKVYPDEYGGYIALNEFTLAHAWNGKPANYSTYA